MVFFPKYSPLIPEHANVPRAVEFTEGFQDLIKKYKEILKIAIETQKKQADKYRYKPPKFKKGDKIWLDSSLIIHKGNKKFKPRKLGPYKILKKVTEDSYKLDLPKSLKFYSIVYVSSLEPY